MSKAATPVVKGPRPKFDALYIEPLAMKKIQYYTDAASGEISGLGIIELDATGRNIVKEVFLFEQECTQADTELNTEAVSALMVEMMKADKDPAKLKFWWHSHVNMGVFWSGTDDAACEILSREFAFSLVVNKKREKLCRLDLYNPFRITFDNIKVTVLPEPEDVPLKEACEEEVKLKVKLPSYNYNRTNTYDHNNRNYGHGYNPEYGIDEYGEGGFFGHRGPHGSRAQSLFRGNHNKNPKIKLSPVQVADIERLVMLADRNLADGGVYASETWDEYIHQTLEDVIEFRLAPKAACKAPLTYDTTYHLCTGGTCKVQKKCAYFTKVLHETEKDATKELQEFEASAEASETTVISV